MEFCTTLNEATDNFPLSLQWKFYTLTTPQSLPTNKICWQNMTSSEKALIG